MADAAGGEVILRGMLFAAGVRTVSAWLRAAELRQRWRVYLNLLRKITQKINELAEIVFERVSLWLRHLSCLVFVLADSPTKRYGRLVQGAGGCPAILPQVRRAMPFSTDMCG